MGQLRGPRRSLRGLTSSLTPAERRSAGAMALVVVGLHAVGFSILFLVIAPHHYALAKAGTFTVGVGLTAYTLGLRHAFDADHIAAIDNTTRKLMSEGRRPLSVGFFFSLGHSTIVFGLTFLLAIGVRALGGSVRDPHSALHRVTSVLGAAVSGSFLYLIAALNLVILVGIVRVFVRMRGGDYDERELEERLRNRGAMNRILRRVSDRVREPWHIYPVGVLFGLGFDTASEVALLFLAGGAATAGLPFYAILALPILFAAGMSLLDTLDGSFMNFAYDWAFSRPVRKVYFNIAVTGLSVAVALVIGTVELLGLAADKLNLRGGFWTWVSGLDINTMGYAIVGLFLLTWLVAVGVWRFGRIEERWSGGPQAGPPPPAPPAQPA